MWGSSKKAKLLNLGSVDQSLFGYPKVKLSEAEEEYHATIWGQSGSGKSFFLLDFFLQHYDRGTGVGLIDPHGDLSRDILKQLISKGAFKNDQAYKKLVYIEWANGYITPFNLLAAEKDPDYTPDKIDMNPTKSRARFMEMAFRVWPELEHTAPAFEMYYGAALRVLIANNLPLAFMYDILMDMDKMKACLKKVPDPRVIETWESLFEMKEIDRNNLLGSARRRAYNLIDDPIAEAAFSTPSNHITHRDWMDNGICFIHNLAGLSELTQRIIGALLLVDIEKSAKSRTKADDPRTPLWMLVDEWQKFADQEKTIRETLSETRKYGLRLYLSSQSLAVVGSDRLAGALENCKLTIAMSLGHESAKKQAEHIGTVDPMAIKEEASSENQHNMFATVFDQNAVWVNELKNLPRRAAYIKLVGKTAIRVNTPLVPPSKASKEDLQQVLDTYRARYQYTVPEGKARYSNIVFPTIEKKAEYLKRFD
jgi:hypothetical protein